MPDRDKVITDITNVVADMQEEVDEWKDYSDSELSHGLTCDCDWWYKALQTLKDAIALLKAQEPEALDVSKPDSEIGCWYDITHNYTLEQVVSALKAQAPRVMTLEEVKAFEWDYCYLEQERQPGKEYRMIAGDYALTCITWPSITSMRIEHGDNSYGVKWRCWTSRPDEKTREATPWN